MTAIRPSEGFSYSRGTISHVNLERYLTSSSSRMTDNIEIRTEDPIETSSNRQTRTNRSLILTLLFDNDQNGIVDGSGDESSPYQIYDNGSALTITNNDGSTYSQESSRNWDIIAATDFNNGFSVLRAGTSRTRIGQYRLWFTNSEGQITSGTRWTSGAQLADEGFEELFSIDLDGDGYVGLPPVQPPQDNDDFGDSIETSGSLSTGNSISGELEVSGDHDWFAISLNEGSTYDFELNGISLSDSYLNLYDSSGVVVAFNDDRDNSSYDSKISTFTANESGFFYLDVGAYDDAYSGTYTLSAVELEFQSGFNPQNGYGQINAQRAFERLLDISLPSVSELGGNLWALDNINVPEVWEGNEAFIGATGEGVTIAVIDTGVDLEHSEFTSRIIEGYDFVDNDTIANDGNGHGTHVAGTIAGSNDGVGITGVAYDSQIMPIRVLDNDGNGYTSDIIEGIRFAADNGADVINLSLGGGGYSQAMADIISYASNLGAVVVMAAGNSYGSYPDYPAAHAVNNGIAVGAVNQLGQLADFSNRAGSNTLDYVTAPGVDIFSSLPSNSYGTYSGTSMAAPHVAGIAGLLMSHNPDLTSEQVESLLIDTASNSNQTGNSQYPSDYDEITNQTGLITLDTIHKFTESDLNGSLIGNIWGDEASRQLTADRFANRDQHLDFNFDGFENFEILDPLTNNFASFALGDQIGTDRISMINTLLSNQYFDYLEIDRTWMMV